MSKQVKMIKVKMLVNTAYQGPRKEGDIIPVPEDFARRWVKNGIAEFAGAQEVEQAEVEEAVDYSSMTAKELYELCKSQGIEVEAKKSKEYYIEKLGNTEE